MENVFLDGFLGSIGEFIVTNPLLGFFLLALVFIVRGETAILISAVFVAQGYLTWPQVWILAFTSVILGDNAVYWFGRIIKDTKLSHWIEKRMGFLPKFREYILKHFVKIALFIKYTVGLTLITITSSGWAGVKFKKFFFWHTLGVTIWLFVMSGVSHLFVSGLGYLRASEVLKNIEVGILIILAVVIFVEILIQRAFKNAATREWILNKIGKIASSFKKNSRGK